MPPYSADAYCHIPACLVTSNVSLNGDGTFSHPEVLLAGQPAADCLLDVDTSHAQLVRTQLLQVRHLTSPEENLAFAKLILAGALGKNIN